MSAVQPCAMHQQCLCDWPAEPRCVNHQTIANALCTVVASSIQNQRAETAVRASPGEQSRRPSALHQSAQICTYGVSSSSTPSSAPRVLVKVAAKLCSQSTKGQVPMQRMQRRTHISARCGGLFYAKKERKKHHMISSSTT